MNMVDSSRRWPRNNFTIKLSSPRSEPQKRMMPTGWDCATGDATQRRPLDREALVSMNMLDVVHWVWNLHSKAKLLDSVYTNLNGEYGTESMMSL